jgi:hypothetical protein
MRKGIAASPDELLDVRFKSAQESVAHSGREGRADEHAEVCRPHSIASSPSGQRQAAPSVA